MFGRNQQSSSTGSDQPQSADRSSGGSHAPTDGAGRPGAKNRPTPTRKEAEAARRQPLVPTDRKAAEKAARQKSRADRLKQREAMYAGEQWALLPRDRGPEMAWVRDRIDARRSIGEFVLPAMLVFLPLSFIQNSSVAVLISMVAIYGLLLAAIVDFLICWFQVRKGYAAKFGVKPSNSVFWAVMARTMQWRSTRVPRPRVARGEYPN